MVSSGKAWLLLPFAYRFPGFRTTPKMAMAAISGEAAMDSTQNHPD
jgi:hypothetical protein